MYMAKWSGLPHLECSWETMEDIKDDEKIRDFIKFNTPPVNNKPTGGQWKELAASPIYKNGRELRPYQLEGLNWLAGNWSQGRGSILADEMGLGKTVQSTSFLDYLFRFQNIPGPFLVIVPLSTMGHWQREIETWTDMNCVVYQGNKENRQVIRTYEWYYPGTLSIKVCYHFWVRV
jgi:SNF2 family DNA or RNA helicase